MNQIPMDTDTKELIELGAENRVLAGKAEPALVPVESRDPNLSAFVIPVANKVVGPSVPVSVVAGGSVKKECLFDIGDSFVSGKNVLPGSSKTWQMTLDLMSKGYKN